jgi:hypothetical protein
MTNSYAYCLAMDTIITKVLNETEFTNWQLRKDLIKRLKDDFQNGVTPNQPRYELPTAQL